MLARHSSWMGPERLMADSAARRFYDERVYGEYFSIQETQRVADRFPVIVDLLTQGHRDGWRRVLDVGPENPSVPRFLSSRLSVPMTRYHCIDVSSKSVTLLTSAGFPALQIDVSVETLPFPDGHFDLVLMTEVIEHLFDPDHALLEIHRVLAAGGVLVVTTPNLASWANRILLLVGRQPMMTETSTALSFGWGTARQGRRPVGHLRLYVRRALVEMLVHYGFRVELLRGLPYGPNLPRDFPALHLLDRIFASSPDLSGGLLVIASKLPQEAGTANTAP